MKTMYAIAINYSPFDDPGNVAVLGWSNEYDYYATGRTVSDILGEKPENGMIDADYGVFVYADEDPKQLEDRADDARRDLLDEVTIIKIDETDDEFEVTPVQ